MLKSDLEKEYRKELTNVERWEDIATKLQKRIEVLEKEAGHHDTQMEMAVSQIERTMGMVDKLITIAFNLSKVVLGVT